MNILISGLRCESLFSGADVNQAYDVSYFITLNSSASIYEEYMVKKPFNITTREGEYSDFYKSQINR